jgi:hypothetical protein
LPACWRFPGKLGALGLWTGLACTASIQAPLMTLTVLMGYGQVSWFDMHRVVVYCTELHLFGMHGEHTGAADDADRLQVSWVEREQVCNVQ